MNSRLFALLAFSATLPVVLSACETSGSGEMLKEASTTIQASAPAQQFAYTSPTQISYNPFTVDIWSQPAVAGGPAKSYVRVAAPNIGIGSPQHEAVARAVVVEVANERLCQPGTQPQFDKQYGHDVYLNERVQKWGAIVSCVQAPAFSPMNGGAIADASGNFGNSGGYGSGAGYGGGLAAAPLPPSTMTPMQSTNAPLPLSMMTSDDYR